MLLDQLELALDELTASATEDELAAEKAAAGTTEVKGFVRRKPSRKPFPEHLPRERVVVPAPTSCACCGSERLSKIGEDVTETLEIIPRRWKVIQTVREKFTCRDCESISPPPAPFHAVPRGWAGPNLLATILFEKYGQHQPLNRQSKRYAKEGVDPRWLGGELGITMVLHTWGQNLGQHIHVHCIVTGGALSPDQQSWIAPSRKGFLFPTAALSKVFRGKYLDFLTDAHRKGELRMPGSDGLDDSHAFECLKTSLRQSTRRRPLQSPTAPAIMRPPLAPGISP